VAGPKVNIRELRAGDRDAWLIMRERLWPDFSRDELGPEEAEMFADRDRNRVFVAEADPGALVGFVEASIRGWAEGCSTRPVGYVEGWYVLPEFRRGGIGRRLIEAAEHWAASCGCIEMGSDAELANEVSHHAHQSLGYREIVRTVAFAKRLTG
jgi:aminoglycoside 6'-N-acetyltransferase I